MKEFKTVEAKCQGECPNCLSNDLDYQGLEVEGTYAWYPFKCNNCNAVGSEGYNMIYDDSEADVEYVE